MRLDEETLERCEINELRETVEHLKQVKAELQRSEELYRFLTEHSIDAISARRSVSICVRIFSGKKSLGLST